LVTRGLRLLGQLWSLPYAAIGLAGALVFWGLGWVDVAAWRNGALELVCGGPFARWMNRPRPQVESQQVRQWNGFTLGWTIFFWRAPDGHLRAHERRHVDQALWLGVLYPVLYLALLLVRGYREHPLEVDARRAAHRELEDERGG
jgi:hypothetical protein